MRYKLWLVPSFLIADADRHLSELPEAHISSLMESIKVSGLRNPLLVTKDNGKYYIHPGKSRAEALVRLGITSAPAVIYDKDRSDSIPGGHPLPMDKAAIQRLFVGDIVVEMSDRFFAIKKA